MTSPLCLRTDMNHDVLVPKFPVSNYSGRKFSLLNRHSMNLNYSGNFSKHVVDPILETPHIACSPRVSPTALKGEPLFTIESATRLRWDLRANIICPLKKNQQLLTIEWRWSQSVSLASERAACHTLQSIGPS